MIKPTLLLGLNDKDTKTQKIGLLDAYKIAMQLIVANGYEGGTISDSTGFYTHQDGTLTIEKSLRIEILFADDRKTTALINDLKRVFNQESVAFQSDDIKSELK